MYKPIEGKKLGGTTMKTLINIMIIGCLLLAVPSLNGGTIVNSTEQYGMEDIQDTMRPNYDEDEDDRPINR